LWIRFCFALLIITHCG